MSASALHTWVPCCGVLDRELAGIGRPAAPRPYRPGQACPPGCNCVALLLGPERYERELAAGALFLLEGWARTWSAWAATVIGGGDRGLRLVLGAGHSALVAVRTPCSGDFGAEAEAIAQRAGLPLRWLDVGLDALAASGGASPEPGGRP